MMKRLLAVIGISLCLGLAACGGNDSPNLIVAKILSDPTYDGDIEVATDGSTVVTQGMSQDVQSVLSGIDPQTGSEFRAFLDFDLSSIPGNAGIDSAYLEIYIDDLQTTTGTLPLLVELVEFQPPTLIASDFDRTAQPPLASVRLNPPISASDVGKFVPIDVSSLMAKAQQLGLADFQVRIMEDVGPAVPSLIAIDDATGANRSSYAPLLTVTYF